jgi:hypothetical protein
MIEICALVRKHLRNLFVELMKPPRVQRVEHMLEDIGDEAPVS